jgi:hypothetical protein
MFGHKHVKSIHSQEEFFNELKSKEPGVFRLESSSRYLDHAFILIKMVGVNGIPSYKVVQSFNKVYTLKQFLQNHGNHYVYKNFQDLECRFLEPLIRLLSTKGVFTIAELQLFSELTCVDLNVLKEMPLYRDKLNRPIPSPGLGISITRTSNDPNSLT